MILIKLLNSSSFYGETETIEIAKGRYKLPETLMEGYNQIIREYKWTSRAI